MDRHMAGSAVCRRRGKTAVPGGRAAVTAKAKVRNTLLDQKMTVG